MLTDLTRIAANRIVDGIDRDVRPNKAPQAEIFPSAAAYHRSYAIWNPYKYEKGQKNENGDDVWIWRVKEFLGLDRGDPNARGVADNWQSVGADIPEPEIVVLNDAGLGFREMKDYWPESVRNQQCGPVVRAQDGRPGR